MQKNKGFTLVELLVVITILGILATIGLVAFGSAQIRGRDAQRKSDLKQIASALEIFNADYGTYPTVNNGLIMGCPTGSACTWGSSSALTDNKTVYMKVVPKDPSSGHSYYYRTVSVDGIANTGFQLFAYLENTQDPSKITTSYPCGGSSTCNYAVTSANTTPSE